MIDFSWKDKDPRHSINKRDEIVILRPHVDGGRLEAGTGYVDTKEDWNVLTSFENRRLISADDGWEAGWLWTWAPRKPA